MEALIILTLWGLALYGLVMAISFILALFGVGDEQSKKPYIPSNYRNTKL